MKTTLELPDELIRAVQAHAAQRQREPTEVLVEAIACGLQQMRTETSDATNATAPIGTVISDDAIAALMAAGDEMARQGVDFAEWAKHSRDVWR